MRILIDGRFYGLEHAGLGRYTTNLIEQLKKIDKKNEYVVFLRKKYFDSLSFPKNWQKVEVEIPHYSFKEQISLPGLIRKFKPDLAHFPHFNVPILWRGNYVVTIHDMLMHAFRGKDTTTLNPVKYILKRFLGYDLAFSRAVRGAKKVIVPTKAIKSEVVKAYKKDKNDVVVTYEGVDKKFSLGAAKKKVFEKYKVKGEYFIYTGNAYPHKNLEKAVDAVVQLNEKKGQKAQLLIASVRNVFVRRLSSSITNKKADRRPPHLPIKFFPIK